ncbi:MAG: hypothetical protein ACRCZI_09725 [Cetobacterium sp.]
MFKEKITHARFDLPEPAAPAYHVGHPLRNKATHDRLLDYLKQRLLLGKEQRDCRLARYSQIDRDLAAFLRLSDEDQKRQIEHEKNGTPQATAISLPLMFVHIDDMMTYYAQTFAPNRGMFYHTARPEDSEEANQLVTIMNSHAVFGGFYRQLLRAIFSILKYNSGGVWNSWDTEYGPKLEAEEGGGTRLAQTVTFKGNRIKAIDMYNFFCDPAVEMCDLHKDGEFAAVSEMKSHYWMKARCLEGLYMNCADILDGDMEGFVTDYYRDPPIESRLSTDNSTNATGSNFSWYKFITGSDSYMANGAFELTTIHIRLNPNDFALIGGKASDRAGRNRYEVWRFTILNGKRIIESTYMNNMHGHLPVYLGVLNDDIMGEAAKSVAEILNPLQQFSSFLLNAHVLANRKNIYGTTYYDPSCVDMDVIPQGEVAARVPIKPQGWGKDIRTMVQHDNNQLDTKQTLQDLQGMMGLIDQFFPTQSLPSQIAGIDRAVTDQVAAVQQGANRRQHKGARLIDDTMLRPMRFSMYYNIVQYQKDNEEISDYYTGKTVKVNLDKLRDVNLSLIIGQGLKALDRQAIQQQMREIIFAMIQAPTISERIDLLGMLDAWTNMMDLEMNLKQFELTPPQAALPAPGVDAASGTGIVPATAPEAVAGGPIYE